MLILLRAGNNRNALRDPNRIIERRNRIRNALAAPARAGGSNALKAAQRAEITNAVAAYGTEGHDNGVSVGVGRLSNGAASETRLIAHRFLLTLIRMT